jgi:hypothetical protein
LLLCRKKDSSKKVEIVILNSQFELSDAVLVKHAMNVLSDFYQNTDNN